MALLWDGAIPAQTEYKLVMLASRKLESSNDALNILFKERRLQVPSILSFLLSFETRGRGFLIKWYIFFQNINLMLSISCPLSTK